VTHCRPASALEIMSMSDSTRAAKAAATPCCSGRALCRWCWPLACRRDWWRWLGEDVNGIEVGVQLIGKHPLCALHHLTWAAVGLWASFVWRARPQDSVPEFCVADILNTTYALVSLLCVAVCCMAGSTMVDLMREARARHVTAFPRLNRLFGLSALVPINYVMAGFAAAILCYPYGSLLRFRPLPGFEPGPNRNCGDTTSIANSAVVSSLYFVPGLQGFWCLALLVGAMVAWRLIVNSFVTSAFPLPAPSCEEERLAARSMLDDGARHRCSVACMRTGFHKLCAGSCGCWRMGAPAVHTTHGLMSPTAVMRELEELERVTARLSTVMMCLFVPAVFGGIGFGVLNWFLLVQGERNSFLTALVAIILPVATIAGFNSWHGEIASDIRNLPRCVLRRYLAASSWYNKTATTLSFLEADDMESDADGHDHSAPEALPVAVTVTNPLSAAADAPAAPQVKARNVTRRPALPWTDFTLPDGMEALRRWYVDTVINHGPRLQLQVFGLPVNTTFLLSTVGVAAVSSIASALVPVLRSPPTFLNGLK